jgi:Tfp pilus assembly PilM family ATPase
MTSRPGRCLKIGAEMVAWAETERNWRGGRRDRCVVSPIPDGAVRPSPADQNVSDLAGLQSRIRALTGPSQQLRQAGRLLAGDIPRPIVLLVPDAAVRAVVLQLDELPSQREERDALIRWRLGQEQLFPLGGAKIVSQVFSSSTEDRSRHSVLAVAVQEAVLQQYESLCESAGLIPLEVGMTSLQLFELWRKTSSAWRGRDFLWANLADRALTTMVFQQGQLLFYRCKLLGSEAMTISAKTDMLKKIVQECGASLDACQQRHPNALINEAVICADGDVSALGLQIKGDLDLSVEQLNWVSLEAMGRTTKGSQRNIASLAAMAGVA